MKNKTFLIFSMLLITSLFIGFASAIPEPSAFYGEVTFEGNPVPNGYTIVTEIDDIENVKCSVIDGKYGYGSNACIVTYDFNEGESSPTIDFYIQELKIGSHIFIDKEITQLDFSLSYLPELPVSSTPSNGGSTSTSTSGGGGGGGSSGGGGGGVASTTSETNTTFSAIEDSEEACVENWVCGPWSDSDNSCGTRICRDANECGTEFSKPAIEKSCFPYNFFSWLTGAVIGGTGSGSTGTGILWILVIILIGVGILILASTKDTKNQKKK